VRRRNVGDDYIKIKIKDIEAGKGDVQRADRASKPVKLPSDVLQQN
jgi:hypothetical protein